MIERRINFFAKKILSNLWVLIVGSTLMSIITFFHFLLGHDFNLIDSWLRNSIWVIVFATKIVCLFSYYLVSENKKKYQLKILREDRIIFKTLSSFTLVFLITFFLFFKKLGISNLSKFIYDHIFISLFLFLESLIYKIATYEEEFDWKNILINSSLSTLTLVYTFPHIYDRISLIIFLIVIFSLYVFSKLRSFSVLTIYLVNFILLTPLINFSYYVKNSNIRLNFGMIFFIGLIYFFYTIKRDLRDAK